MRTIYQSIWLQIPYDIIQVTDVKLQEEMNQHAYLQIRAVIEDEKQEDTLNLLVENEQVKAGFLENENSFFSGSIEQLSCYYEKGQLMILLIVASETKKWDIALRSRSFQNMDFTYDDVINQVLSAYPGASWISHVNTHVKIPGLLLQYEETDWEFLCRLASHFGTFLLVEPAGDAGQLYFGLPDNSQGRHMDEKTYRIIQNMARYETYTGNADDIMLQDNLEWEVTGREAFCLGEKVTWNQVLCQITRVMMETKGSELWYTCSFRRSEGVRSVFYGNRKISGLSLPAVIKERSGNCLRVHFSIDPVFNPGNLVYFTFAIETTSWYCIPEVGSLVHIYFQNWDETTGIAVHAMRMSGGTGSVSAKGAVSDKSFSTSDGKAMQFTEPAITFVSANNGISTFSVSKDGNINMEAINVSLSTDVKMSIGKGTVLVGENEEEIIVKNLTLETEGDNVVVGIIKSAGEELKLYEDRGIVMNEEGELMLAAPTKLSYNGWKKDPPGIQYSDEALKAADKEQREKHNAEVFAVREKESRGKIGIGGLLMIGGAVIIGVGAIALTGGLGAPVVGPSVVAIIGGVVGGACGAAQVAEGIDDYSKISSGDFSQSYNVVRDGFCGGDQNTYNAIMYGSIMIGAGAAIGIFTGPLLKGMKPLIKCAAQMVTAASMTATTQLMQDLTDGFIDQSWQDYALNTGIAALTAGIGYGVGEGFLKVVNTPFVRNILNQSGAFAPALIIGAETGIDMAVDKGIAMITGQDYDWRVSLATALGSNIAFSIDPVNMATGAFCLTCTDLMFPDIIDDHFQLQRIYNSVLPCHGGLGRNWMLGLESRLVIWENEELIDVMCTDGHVERFRSEGNEWINRRENDRRYQLKKQPDGNGYTVIYIPEQKCYSYDSMGRLLSIHGKGEGRLEIEYQESRIRRVVTSSGYILEFKYEENHIVEIRDEMGRTIRYRYEEDCLKAVCHVDEGVTTYHYDKSYNIIQVIDQNGHAYVTNEYDDKGRVIAQHYLDGTKSTLTYDMEKRETTVFIEALGRTEKYRYNKDNLVTHTIYDDGSIEETGYDQWTNRILEKDRNGNIIKRSYNEWGMLLDEELPSGQKWSYEYDEKGGMLSKKANTGENSWFRYNEAGYLVEEAEKLKEAVWKRKQYERDKYGRIIKQTDSLGHITTYLYEDKQGHIQQKPSQVTDALNQRISYEYDQAGRQIRITTECGTTEVRYNNQNYPSYIQDGNGNEFRKVYDKMGNLTAMFPPNEGIDGKAWMYRYDFFDRLIETRDPLGNIWKKERNLAGDIVSEISPEGCETRYEYNTDSLKVRTVYPDGSVERCFYDGNGNLVKKVRPEYYDPDTDDGPGVVYEYDSMNRLVQITGEDGTVRNTFCYDLSGNMVRQTDGTGYETLHSYDYAGNRTATWKPLEEKNGEVWYCVTIFEYDSESNRILEKRGLDKVRAGEYADYSHELKFIYDALNRLTSVKDSSGAKASYTYNSLNQKTSESFRIGPNVERMILYKYDGAGRLVEKKEGIEERFLKPGGKRNTVWAVTRYEYDKNGNCIRSISPNGYEREKYYDAINRVVREEKRDQKAGIRRIYCYEYDGNGSLIKWLDESMEGQKKTRIYRYDRKERLTHFTDEAGGTTRLFYDRNDRIVKVVRPEQYDRFVDDGAGTVYSYDFNDRVTEITGPDQSAQCTYSYDSAGNVKSMLEGEHIYTEYEYDLAGNPVAVYEGREKAGKKKAAQQLAYDAWGNITGIEDGNQNQTGFILDDWGRITEIHTPEGGIERYTYDYAGNITSTTDANGGTITYRYNSLGQVYEAMDQEGNSEYFYYDEEGRQETYIDRNGNVERTHYNMDNRLTYQRAEDKKGRNPIVNQYVYYPDGRLKEAAGGGITYRYEYTEQGLLKRKSASEKTLLEYGYDKNRNITSITDGTGKTVRYIYDEMNRMTRAEEAEQGTALASFQYTPFGQVEAVAYGNGVRSRYEYEENGAITSLVTVTPEGRVLLNFDYAYDGNGNCTKKSGNRYQNTYAYDQMNRLTEAVYDGRREQYTYDFTGNRLKKETEKEQEFYAYNAKNQLIRLEKGAGITDYLYDNQGNLLEEAGRGGKKYTYDALNRLSSVESDTFMQRNRYDGERLRYETEENDKTIRFVYDRGELSTEEKAEGKIRYIHGKHKVIASERQAGDTGYHIEDEAGSTIYILDRERNLRKAYRYDAFGKMLEEKGEIENRLTYRGQMYDGVAGQYYLRARFYNPIVGRFLQEDVYRGDGLNLYAYCANNPVMYYDPSGYMGLCPLPKQVPGALTQEEINKMIEFPGEVVHPGTVTPDNPWGIYTIRATGDYAYDKILLAEAAGISVPDGQYWKAHHIEYDSVTNTMRMQFVDESYHYHSHFGGAGEFERITGYKYGTPDAMSIARSKNIEYLIGLIKNSTR